MYLGRFVSAKGRILPSPLVHTRRLNAQPKPPRASTDTKDEACTRERLPLVGYPTSAFLTSERNLTSSNKECAHLAFFMFHCAYVMCRHRRLFKQDITSTNKRLTLGGPEALARVLLDVFVQLLIRVAHPRIDQLCPVFRGQIAVDSQL